MKIYYKKILISFLIIFTAVILSAEDYQYQYFSEEKSSSGFLPFSDYVPLARLHYETTPHNLEDYYLLYGLKQYYNENTLRRNIEYLKIALKSSFRHPSKALVKIGSDKEYHKYRNLMFMHINLLIMRSHMMIAARYDRIDPKFYDTVFSKEISESLGNAEMLYKEAIPYWIEAKKYAQEASRIRVTTELSFMESERYSISNGTLNFEKIINDHLKGIDKKRQKLAATSGIR